MLGKLSLVTLTLGFLCISGSDGSIDRVIDRMMQRMFIESARMTGNIANVPLPRGFWATNRIVTYPQNVNFQPIPVQSRQYFSRNIYPQPYSSYSPNLPYYRSYSSHPSGSMYNYYYPTPSNSIYEPKFTFNRQGQIPTMPRFPTSPMAIDQQRQTLGRMFTSPAVSTLARPQNRFTSIRGPVLQVNLKVKPPVNKSSKKRYDGKVNLTANIEKEAVGEIVASWNTEMKEVSISGTKNETKIKTFKNNGNIHSHLGTGLESEVHFNKMRRRHSDKAQSVPESTLLKKKVNSEGKNLLMNKINQAKMDDVRDTMKYNVNQQQQIAKSLQEAAAVTLAPMINLLPRQQRTMLKANF